MLTRFVLLVLMLSVPVPPACGQPAAAPKAEEDAVPGAGTQVWDDDLELPDDFESGLVWSSDSYRFRLWGNVRNLTAINSLNDDSLLNPDNINRFADWQNDTEAHLKLDGAITDYFQIIARQRFSYEVEGIDGKTETDFDADTDQLYGTVEFAIDPTPTFVSVGKQRIKWARHSPGIRWTHSIPART